MTLSLFPIESNGKSSIAIPTIGQIIPDQLALTPMGERLSMLLGVSDIVIDRENNNEFSQDFLIVVENLYQESQHVATDQNSMK